VFLGGVVGFGRGFWGVCFGFVLLLGGFFFFFSGRYMLFVFRFFFFIWGGLVCFLGGVGFFFLPQNKKKLNVPVQETRAREAELHKSRGKGARKSTP